MSKEKAYLESLLDQLWNYANSEPEKVLTSLEYLRSNSVRPPVFKEQDAIKNMFIPPDMASAKRRELEAIIPERERHRWFRSMKSSQALAHSVFGNLVVNGNLHLLKDLISDEGLPAFCPDIGAANIQLEYAVNHLGEPRSTSIDLWVEGVERVAVEIKLTEMEFGTCSRPRLVEGEDRNYYGDYCDGSYTQQMDRRSRCSLTEIGVKYWNYIPQLLNWNGDQDIESCPLNGTYQLVRNILAACVKPSGELDFDNSHMLVVYDARNPSFQEGGIAHSQLESAHSALIYPQLLRSCSWQSLALHLASQEGEAQLLDWMFRKFGF